MCCHRSPINTQTPPGLEVSGAADWLQVWVWFYRYWLKQSPGQRGWQMGCGAPLLGLQENTIKVRRSGAGGWRWYADNITYLSIRELENVASSGEREEPCLGWGGGGWGVACERMCTETSDTVDACHLGFSAVKLKWHKEPRAALSEIQRWTLHNSWVTHHLFLWLWGVCECPCASISLRAGRHFFPQIRHGHDITTPGCGLGFWGLRLEWVYFSGVCLQRSEDTEKRRWGVLGMRTPQASGAAFQLIWPTHRWNWSSCAHLWSWLHNYLKE